MGTLKKHLPTIILILVFCTGICLLLYPTVSDYWNSFHQTKAITSYVDTVSEMDEKTYEQMLHNAKEYNAELMLTGPKWKMTDREMSRYENLLNVSDNGMMGYIELPSIGCKLPIYHGTSDGVLKTGVGHIEGTSLPIGGKNTHAVISGHRGLPSARLFTDLDRIVEGDIFELHILNEVLTYQVDQIRIVKPDNVSNLMIEKGKDYCTLVTCTPYGVNSHRLLVRGHRTPNRLSINVEADAVELDKMLSAVFISIPILILLLVILLVRTRKTKLLKGKTK